MKTNILRSSMTCRVCVLFLSLIGLLAGCSSNAIQGDYILGSIPLSVSTSDKSTSLDNQFYEARGAISDNVIGTSTGGYVGHKINW